MAYVAKQIEVSPLRGETSICYTTLMSFNIINETKDQIPEADYKTIKEEALGKDYRLTLIFTDPERLKKLNTIYRDKTHTTDILSFPYSEDEGEIYICLSEAEKEASKFNRPIANFIPFLFIHGCVHLKGHDHGSKMEAIESSLRKKFNI